MTVETDDRGRIHLEKRLREQYGERFHVVAHEETLDLIPIADDPLSSARDAVGAAFDDVSIGELREIAEERARRQTRTGLEDSDN